MLTLVGNGDPFRTVMLNLRLTPAEAGESKHLTGRISNPGGTIRSAHGVIPRLASTIAACHGTSHTIFMLKQILSSPGNKFSCVIPSRRSLPLTSTFKVLGIRNFIMSPSSYGVIG